MSRKIRISGTGCALADFVYNHIDFSGAEFQQYVLKKEGDGGLSTGKLVFTEELEKFAGKNYTEIITAISKGKEAETFNIGGPSLVSLIHAAQVLDKASFQVNFYGISGRDETAQKIRNLLQKTPVGFSAYLKKSNRPTPFTHVLSDPGFDNGNGERTFINNIGAAWDLIPEELPDEFFASEIVCFGGTALTPNIHDNLHKLLERAKKAGAFTIVNTVYDFRNEKQNPGKAWPLGDTLRSLSNTDLLIMDNEEALRISGFSHIGKASEYFMQNSSAFIITRGAEKTIFYSNGTFFDRDFGELPVSSLVSNKIKKGDFTGDTTGCGDNFAGGVIAAVAMLRKKMAEKCNLKEVVVTGICSGGFACSYTGGTYFEKVPGEKKKQIDSLIKAYQRQ